MPAFILRRIDTAIWQKFRDRADAQGTPYRWVILQLIEDWADGKITMSPRRPPEERPTRRESGNGPVRTDGTPRWEI